MNLKMTETWTGLLCVKGQFVSRTKATGHNLSQYRRPCLNICHKYPVKDVYEQFVKPVSSLDLHAERQWGSSLFINLAILRPCTAGDTNFIRLLNTLHENQSAGVAKVDQDLVLLVPAVDMSRNWVSDRSSQMVSQDGDALSMVWVSKQSKILTNTHLALLSITENCLKIENPNSLVTGEIDNDDKLKLIIPETSKSVKHKPASENSETSSIKQMVNSQDVMMADHSSSLDTGFMMTPPAASRVHAAKLKLYFDLCNRDGSRVQSNVSKHCKKRSTKQTDGDSQKSRKRHTSDLSWTQTPDEEIAKSKKRHKSHASSSDKHVSLDKTCKENEGARHDSRKKHHSRSKSGTSSSASRSKTSKDKISSLSRESADKSSIDKDARKKDIGSVGVKSASETKTKSRKSNIHSTLTETRRRDVEQVFLDMKIKPQGMAHLGRIPKKSDALLNKNPAVAKQQEEELTDHVTSRLETDTRDFDDLDTAFFETDQGSERDLPPLNITDSATLQEWIKSTLQENKKMQSEASDKPGNKKPLKRSYNCTLLSEATSGKHTMKPSSIEIPADPSKPQVEQIANKLFCDGCDTGAGLDKTSHATAIATCMSGDSSEATHPVFSSVFSTKYSGSGIPGLNDEQTDAGDAVACTEAKLEKKDVFHKASSCHLTDNCSRKVVIGQKADAESSAHKTQLTVTIKGGSGDNTCGKGDIVDVLKVELHRMPSSSKDTQIMDECKLHSTIKSIHSLGGCAGVKRSFDVSTRTVKVQTSVDVTAVCQSKWTHTNTLPDNLIIAQNQGTDKAEAIDKHHNNIVDCSPPSKMKVSEAKTKCRLPSEVNQLKANSTNEDHILEDAQPSCRDANVDEKVASTDQDAVGPVKADKNNAINASTDRSNGQPVNETGDNENQISASTLPKTALSPTAEVPSKDSTHEHVLPAELGDGIVTSDSNKYARNIPCSRLREGNLQLVLDAGITHKEVTNTAGTQQPKLNITSSLPSKTKPMTPTNEKETKSNFSDTSVMKKSPSSLLVEPKNQEVNYKSDSKPDKNTDQRKVIVKSASPSYQEMTKGRTSNELNTRVSESSKRVTESPKESSEMKTKLDKISFKSDRRSSKEKELQQPSKSRSRRESGTSKSDKGNSEGNRTEKVTEAVRQEKRQSRQYHPYRKERREEKEPRKPWKPRWSFDIAYRDMSELLQNMTQNIFRDQSRKPTNVSTAPRSRSRKHTGRFRNFTFVRSEVPRTPPRDSGQRSEDEEEQPVIPEVIPDLEERGRQADLMEEIFFAPEEQEEFSVELGVYANDKTVEATKKPDKASFPLVIPGGPKTFQYSGVDLDEDNESSLELVSTGISRSLSTELKVTDDLPANHVAVSVTVELKDDREKKKGKTHSPRNKEVSGSERKKSKLTISNDELTVSKSHDTAQFTESAVKDSGEDLMSAGETNSDLDTTLDANEEHSYIVVDDVEDTEEVITIDDSEQEDLDKGKPNVSHCSKIAESNKSLKTIGDSYADLDRTLEEVGSCKKEQDKIIRVETDSKPAKEMRIISPSSDKKTETHSTTAESDVAEDGGLEATDETHDVDKSSQDEMASSGQELIATEMSQGEEAIDKREKTTEVRDMCTEGVITDSVDVFTTECQPKFSQEKDIDYDEENFTNVSPKGTSKQPTGESVCECVCKEEELCLVHYSVVDAVQDSDANIASDVEVESLNNNTDGISDKNLSKPKKAATSKTVTSRKCECICKQEEFCPVHYSVVDAVQDSDANIASEVEVESINDNTDGISDKNLSKPSTAATSKTVYRKCECICKQEELCAVHYSVVDAVQDSDANIASDVEVESINNNSDSISDKNLSKPSTAAMSKIAADRKCECICKQEELCAVHEMSFSSESGIETKGNDDLCQDHKNMLHVECETIEAKDCTVKHDKLPKSKSLNENQFKTIESGKNENDMLSDTNRKDNMTILVEDNKPGTNDNIKDVNTLESEASAVTVGDDSRTSCHNEAKLTEEKQSDDLDIRNIEASEFSKSLTGNTDDLSLETAVHTVINEDTSTDKDSHVSPTVKGGNLTNNEKESETVEGIEAETEEITEVTDTLDIDEDYSTDACQIQMTASTSKSHLNNATCSSIYQTRLFEDDDMDISMEDVEPNSKLILSHEEYMQKDNTSNAAPQLTSNSLLMLPNTGHTDISSSLNVARFSPISGWFVPHQPSPRTSPSVNMNLQSRFHPSFPPGTMHEIPLWSSYQHPISPFHPPSVFYQWPFPVPPIQPQFNHSPLVQSHFHSTIFPSHNGPSYETIFPSHNGPPYESLVQPTQMPCTIHHSPSGYSESSTIPYGMSPRNLTNVSPSGFSDTSTIPYGISPRRLMNISQAVFPESPVVASFSFIDTSKSPTMQQSLEQYKNIELNNEIGICAIPDTEMSESAKEKLNEDKSSVLELNDKQHQSLDKGTTELECGMSLRKKVNEEHEINAINVKSLKKLCSKIIQGDPVTHRAWEDEKKINMATKEAEFNVRNKTLSERIMTTPLSLKELSEIVIMQEKLEAVVNVDRHTDMTGWSVQDTDVKHNHTETECCNIEPDWKILHRQENTSRDSDECHSATKKQKIDVSCDEKERTRSDSTEICENMEKSLEKDKNLMDTHSNEFQHLSLKECKDAMFTTRQVNPEVGDYPLNLANTPASDSHAAGQSMEMSQTSTVNISDAMTEEKSQTNKHLDAFSHHSESVQENVNIKKSQSKLAASSILHSLRHDQSVGNTLLLLREAEGSKSAEEGSIKSEVQDKISVNVKELISFYKSLSDTSDAEHHNRQSDTATASDSTKSQKEWTQEQKLSLKQAGIQNPDCTCDNTLKEEKNIFEPLMCVYNQSCLEDMETQLEHDVTTDTICENVDNDELQERAEDEASVKKDGIQLENLKSDMIFEHKASDTECSTSLNTGTTSNGRQTESCASSGFVAAAKSKSNVRKTTSPHSKQDRASTPMKQNSVGNALHLLRSSATCDDCQGTSEEKPNLINKSKLDEKEILNFYKCLSSSDPEHTKADMLRAKKRKRKKSKNRMTVTRMATVQEEEVTLKSAEMVNSPEMLKVLCKKVIDQEAPEKKIEESDKHSYSVLSLKEICLKIVEAPRQIVKDKKEVFHGLDIILSAYEGSDEDSDDNDKAHVKTFGGNDKRLPKHDGTYDCTKLVHASSLKMIGETDVSEPSENQEKNSLDLLSAYEGSDASSTEMIVDNNVAVNARMEQDVKNTETLITTGNTTNVKPLLNKTVGLVNISDACEANLKSDVEVCDATKSSAQDHAVASGNISHNNEFEKQVTAVSDDKVQDVKLKEIDKKENNANGERGKLPGQECQVSSCNPELRSKRAHNKPINIHMHSVKKSKARPKVSGSMSVDDLAIRGIRRNKYNYVLDWISKTPKSSTKETMPRTSRWHKSIISKARTCLRTEATKPCKSEEDRRRADSPDCKGHRQSSRSSSESSYRSSSFDSSRLSSVSSPVSSRWDRRSRSPKKSDSLSKHSNRDQGKSKRNIKHSAHESRSSTLSMQDSKRSDSTDDSKYLHNDIKSPKTFMEAKESTNISNKSTSGNQRTCVSREESSPRSRLSRWHQNKDQERSPRQSHSSRSSSCSSADSSHLSSRIDVCQDRSASLRKKVLTPWRRRYTSSPSSAISEGCQQKPQRLPDEASSTEDITDQTSCNGSPRQHARRGLDLFLSPYKTQGRETGSRLTALYEDGVTVRESERQSTSVTRTQDTFITGDAILEQRNSRWSDDGLRVNDRYSNREDIGYSSDTGRSWEVDRCYVRDEGQDADRSGRLGNHLSPHHMMSEPVAEMADERQVLVVGPDTGVRLSSSRKHIVMDTDILLALRPGILADLLHSLQQHSTSRCIWLFTLLENQENKLLAYQHTKPSYGLLVELLNDRRYSEVIHHMSHEPQVTSLERHARMLLHDINVQQVFVITDTVEKSQFWPSVMNCNLESFLSEHLTSV